MKDLQFFHSQICTLDTSIGWLVVGLTVQDVEGSGLGVVVRGMGENLSQPPLYYRKALWVPQTAHDRHMKELKSAHRFLQIFLILSSLMIKLIKETS